MDCIECGIFEFHEIPDADLLGLEEQHEERCKTFDWDYLDRVKDKLNGSHCDIFQQVMRNGIKNYIQLRNQRCPNEDLMGLYESLIK